MSAVMERPTPMNLFWKKVEAGKRWRVYDIAGNLLGFVCWNLNGWDGYVLTGKPWPESERCISGRYRKRTFWAMRRGVETYICGE